MRCHPGGKARLVALNAPIAPGDTLTQVWSDEFGGAQLDPEVWFFESRDGSQYGIPGWGNNELQWYLPDSSELRDGLLIITAREEAVNPGGSGANTVHGTLYAMQNSWSSASAPFPVTMEVDYIRVYSGDP